MKPKVGMKVMISDRNTNHLGYGVTAYAGVQGKIDWVAEDGSFSIDTGTSIVVCAKKRKKPFYFLYEDIAGSWQRSKI